MMKCLRPRILYLVLFHIIVTPLICYGGDPTQEIKVLKKRLESLERRQADLYHTLKEKKAPGLVREIIKKLYFGGLMEIEGFVEDDDAKGSSSDILLATVEFDMDVEANGMAGHVLFLYEEDITEPMELDEATVTVEVGYGLSLTAGRMYLPFGVLKTHFITDPLILELGETRQTAFLAGYSTKALDLSIGIFNGDTMKDGDNSIDDVVVSLNILPLDNTKIGASYLSNLADTKIGLTGRNIHKEVPGIGLFLDISFKRWLLSWEYIGAGTGFDAKDLDSNNNGRGDRPQAYNMEVAYIISDFVECSLRYEGSREFLDFPEEQYGVEFAYRPFDNTVVAFEYMHGRLGGGKWRKRFTTQLGMEF